MIAQHIRLIIHRLRLLLASSAFAVLLFLSTSGLASVIHAAPLTSSSNPPNPPLVCTTAANGVVSCYKYLPGSPQAKSATTVHSHYVGGYYGRRHHSWPRHPKGWARAHGLVVFYAHGHWWYVHRSHLHHHATFRSATSRARFLRWWFWHLNQQ